jgi:peptidoglycan/LPS O-acetylase OafA/YrhL
MALAAINAGKRFPPGSEFRNLDVLRAVAVLCVFGSHLILTLIKFGSLTVPNKELWVSLFYILAHLGVLYFFVHTALVLMLSLERTKPVGIIVNFYIRRIFRIYPLSILCIVAVLLFRVPPTPDTIYTSWNGGEIFANVLLVQNIFRKPDMITPFWTLPRELQMYLVLPFIYLVLKRFPSSVVVLVLWSAFFAAVPSAPLLSCFPCFMAGVLAYQLGKERVFSLPSVLWPFTILAVTALGFVLTLTVFPDYRADYVACMLLGLAIPNVLELRESWITSASQSVAKYSYGIYLCHDPVIWFAFVRLKSFPAPLQWAALVLLMILVPVLAYRLLEAPLIETGRRVAATWSAASVRRREARKDAFVESAQLAD